MFVMDYLARKELDLHPPRSELSHYQEQCILFVAGQRYKIRDEMKDTGDLDDEALEFRMAADPEEMEVSDRDLLAIGSGKAKRR